MRNRRLLAQLLGLVLVVALVVTVAWFRQHDAPETSQTPTWTQRGSVRARDTQRAHQSKVPTPPVRQTRAHPEDLHTVELDQLPAEAREVRRLLMQGGPFRYSRDGVVFENRNHLLPRRRSGYYREFTVRTPGERDRGARRLVVGGCGRQTSTRPVRASVCTDENPLYWTDDHYASFRRVL